MRDSRLLLLAAGHGSADMCQGAVPTLLPFLIAQRGLTLAASTTLIVAMTTASSILQPLFGMHADRRGARWTLPAALACGGAGIAIAAASSELAVMIPAIALSGLGVAAFHPEAARQARAASGPRAARGMSVFALGGNAGFALAPLLLTPVIVLAGPAGAALVLVPTLACAALLAAAGPAVAVDTGPRAVAAEDDWSAFIRVALFATLRSGIYFGLQAFLAAYFITELHTSEATGNAALTALLVAGAAGTLTGGRLADRFDRRLVLGGYILLVIPLMALLLAVDSPAAAIAAAGLVGFATIGNFSLSVLMAQEYLPGHPALASGIVLGLAIGLGGLVAAALGPLADSAGVPAAMWILASLALPAAALAASLPRPGLARR